MVEESKIGHLSLFSCLSAFLLHTWVIPHGTSERTVLHKRALLALASRRACPGARQRELNFH